MSNNEMCIGCITYVNEVISFGGGIVCPFKTHKQCPCSICLVKSMCDRICEDFQNHLYKYKRNYYE